MDMSETAKLIKKESGKYTGGPIQLFEKVGRDAFIAALRHGLLPHHKVLDFGAGCLRLGFWFVRFLDSGNYYAIEPSDRMLEAGKKHLLGDDIVGAKAPHFYLSDKCDMSAFATRFDFVVARSILTHTSPAMLHRIFAEFAGVAAPSGIMLASYWSATGPKSYSVDGPLGDELPRDEWSFVPVIKYSLEYLKSAGREYGLVVEETLEDTPRLSQQTWLRITAGQTPTRHSKDYPGAERSQHAAGRIKALAERLRGRPRILPKLLIWNRK